ncbi:hypothetical protein [Haloarcula argentinensis]|nr:hypothetical protein [Haloarcula argentinensis]
MADGIGMAAVRIGTSLASSRQTASEIDSKLNEQIAGKSWSISNYRGGQTTITINSITVRPKFSPRKVNAGVQEAEGENLFTEYENERRSATLFERLSAIVQNKWITVVRLEIDGGNAEMLRPPGLSLKYVTSREAVRFNSHPEVGVEEMFSVPAIRVVQPHDMGADKLEMKLPYEGSFGEYRRRISNSIDILKSIQAEPDLYVTRYLLELHHSSHHHSEGDEFEWANSEQVRKLGSFLIGEPVDLEALADHLDDMKRELQEKPLDPDSKTQ